MPIVGTLTATWDSTHSEQLVGTSGSHKYTESGLYRIRVEDEGGNYGYADLLVLITPVISSVEPVDMTTPGAGTPVVNLLVLGSNLDAERVQGYLNPPTAGSTFDPNKWVSVTNPTDTDSAWLPVVSTELDGKTSVQVQFRFRRGTVQYPEWVDLGTYTVRIDRPHVGAFSSEFSSEFDNTSTDVLPQGLSVEDTKTWVGTSRIRAQVALDAENAALNPRTTLISWLAGVLV